MTIDWRGRISRTLEEHLVAIRSHLSDEDARRRVTAGGELNHLVAWLRSQAKDVASGARKVLDGPTKTDPVWVARAKIQFRHLGASYKLRGDMARFLRVIADYAQTWDERSRELLGGAIPPPPPAEARAPSAPPAARAVAAPAAPAPAPAHAAAPAPAPAPAPAAAPAPARAAAPAPATAAPAARPQPALAPASAKGGKKKKKKG